MNQRAISHHKTGTVVSSPRGIQPREIVVRNLDTRRQGEAMWNEARQKREQVRAKRRRFRAADLAKVEVRLKREQFRAK